ncbi:MAG: histidine kinase [Staphylococcus sp.]|nr:histidine kinase [Staphylococcus sp.]
MLRLILSAARNVWLSVLLPLMMLPLLGSCNHFSHSKACIAPDEEEEAFMLVAGPGAEGDYAKAISTADSLLANCTMSDSLRLYVMIERDVALLNRGDLEGAGAFADTLIAEGRALGMGEAVMQGEQNKGIVYRRVELYDSALACYNRGLAIAIGEDNVEMQQTFADMLAVVYAENNHLPEALDFARRSLGLAGELADTTAMVSAIGTVGAILMKEGNYREAVGELRPYAGLSRLTAPLYRIKFLTPLVRSYIALDSLPQAREAIGEMGRCVEGYPRSHQAYSNYLTAEALLLQAEHRYGEAWEVMCELDSLGSHGKAPDVIESERADCLANMGDYRGAYTRMSRAYAALDSLRRTSIDHELADLSVRYDTLSKEMEIASLSRQRWLMVSIVLICLFALCGSTAAAVWYRRRHRLQERLNAIEKKEEYLRGIEQERTRMARELHDNIGGRLLALQYRLADNDHKRIAETLTDIARKVRMISREMMPPEFFDTMLPNLLLDFVRKQNETFPGRYIHLTDEGTFDWFSLTAQQNHELYRIVQEAVSNAIRHSDCNEIRITLDGTDKFRLTIENNGIVPGNASATSPAGIGNQTIKARAAIIGATVETCRTDETYTLYINQL